MDVELYVYDLTRGMARAMSMQLLGIQIDAVYHTSLVFGNIEYFFGMGVQTCRPGTTHHGQPMEKIRMGTTHLPLDTILEYLESLKTVYTPESYDLFAHNCNNFTHDFGMFLVGKGIPDHITSLPRRVLDTPFGQMLKPQLDQSMRAVTQAPVASASAVTPSHSTNGFAPGLNGSATLSNGASKGAYGSVVQSTTQASLDKHIQAAHNTAVTIFFTSSTCAPCRMAYPMFDQLAEQHPNALFVKVDINAAHDIASKYQIRATPTFMTFSRGQKQNEWQGADPSILKANVESLINETFPPHPHARLSVPTLQFGSLKPVSYNKTPPLDKLLVKLGNAGNSAPLSGLRDFVRTRTTETPKNAPLPSLAGVDQAILAVPLESRFAAVDLLRCAAVDVRLSGLLAEGTAASIVPSLVDSVAVAGGVETCPHNLRLVTIHLACNIFLSPVYRREIMLAGSRIADALVRLVTSSLLDASHPTTRVAAASLALNMATCNYRIRREENREGLTDEHEVELAASLVETLSLEENVDAIKVLLLALGYLAYCAPAGGEVMDTCKALDARAIVTKAGKPHGALAREVASLF